MLQLVEATCPTNNNRMLRCRVTMLPLLLLLPTIAANSGCKRQPTPHPPSSEPASATTNASSTELSPQPTAKETPPSVDTPETSNTSNLPLLPRFETIGPESGLAFQRNDDISQQRRIFESTGGGVGIIDLDADGLLDVFFTGGCQLPTRPADIAPTCGLFRNLGAMQFVDRTRDSRLMQAGYCQGVAVGDIDNDGFDDLYVAAFGDNGLWHNNGDGTFTEVTQAAGVNVAAWSTSCAMADINLDGNLDLFVVNYLDDSPTAPLLCPNPEAPNGYQQCAPAKYNGVDDVLFINDGRGGFRDASRAAGLSGLAGKGLGVVVSDFDRNGTPEIYVGNDGQANFLLQSTADIASETDTDHTPQYNDTGLLSGTALSRAGYAQASMGIAAGDYDNSGTIDLIITNFHGDSNIVYENNGQLQFADVTRSSGLAGPSRGVLGWGAVLFDVDNDSDLDLFVANGHVEDRRWIGNGEPYQMLPQLFVNSGGQYREITNTAGEYFSVPTLGRGVAFADLDRDGLTDLAVSHQLAPSVVLANRTQHISPHRTLRFVGTRSNRNGIGVQVELLDARGQMLLYRELTGGTSFQAAMPHEVYLPILDGAAALRVIWPSGREAENSIQDLENQTLYLTE
ncbi:MAG: FG-GAP-like repeat-containing protein [Pirellulaceae bacterium]